MKLTRRDAIEALVASGIGSAAALAASERATDRGALPEADSSITGPVRTMTAVAEVVYPTAVTPTTEFVSAYVRGSVADRQRAIVETTAALDDYARAHAGDEFQDLAVDRREGVLRTMGVHRVASNPDGTTAERVRYYLVDGTLFALFTSPKGSRLFGIENPVGYPGGYESK